MENNILKSLAQQNAQGFQTLQNNSADIAKNTSDMQANAPVQATSQVSAPVSQDNQPQDNQQTSQPTQSQSDTGNGGNWFTRLLPTVGSIAAPLAAVALAPETGGLSLLAEIAASGAGSALGKGAENLLEGKNPINDIGASAAEGAVGGGIGAGAGKALEGVAGMVGKIADKGISDASAKAAAENAVENAQATRNVFGGLNKQTLQNNNLADTQNLAKSIGIDHNSPEAFVQTANHAGDILNDSLNTILTNGGHVDMSKLNDIYKEAIAKNAGVIGSIDPVALSKGRMGLPNTPGAKLFTQLQNLSAGIANKSAVDPVEVRGLISKIGSLGADAKPGISATTGAVDPAQKALYNTIQDIYGNLKDTLYNRPEIQKMVSTLQGGIGPEDVGGNQLLSDYLNKTIGNSSSAQDILDELSKFTKMNTLGNEALKSAQNTASAATLNTAKQAVPELSTVAPAVPLTTKPSLPGMIQKAMGALGNGGNTSQIASKMADTLTSSSKFVPNNAGPNSLTNAGVLGLIGGNIAANSPNMTQAAGGNQQVALPTSLEGGAQPTNPYAEIMGSNNMFSLPLRTALINQQFRQIGDTTNYLDTPGTLAAIEKLQGVSGAEAQLPELIAAYNAAGGAQGGILGRLAQLGGMVTGGPAAQYQQRADALQRQILESTGQNIALPSLTMNQSAAQGVLQQLASALGQS